MPRPLHPSLVLAVLWPLATLRAADTTETWSVGATDVDVFFHAEGLGHDRDDQITHADLQLGYGLFPRFSAYLATSLQADGYLRGGAPSLGIGVFGTPIETDHVDLDLFFETQAGGKGFGEFHLVPALELNLDAAPELESFGAYVRLAVPVSGHAEGGEVFGPTRSSPYTHVEAALGGYWTVRTDHQLLVEVDAEWLPRAVEGERAVDLGGVALGYNWSLAEGFEILSHVLVDVPQDDDPWAFGGMIGVIATLPGR